MFLMTRTTKTKLVAIVVAGVVAGVSNLFPHNRAAAQSPRASAAFIMRLAQTSRTAHKPRVAAAVKPGATARPINAAELQALLKRDDNHPLLVNYWATWCDPCRDEFPDLVKIDA